MLRRAGPRITGLVLLLLGTAACGQSEQPTGADEPKEAPGSIGGVVETTTEAGVAGARVSVNNGTAFKDDTLTDSSGSYRFDDVPPGEYTVAAVPPSGFRPGPSDTVSVSLMSGERERVVFTVQAVRTVEDTVVPGASDTLRTGHGIEASVTTSAESGALRVVLEAATGRIETADSIVGPTGQLKVEPVSSSSEVAADVGVKADEHRSAEVTLRVPQPDSSNRSIQFVYEPRGESDLPEETLYGDASRVTQKDPLTRATRRFAESTRPIGLLAGMPLDLRFGVSYSDEECSDRFRQLAAAPNGPSLERQIPVVLVHGWQASGDDCSDFRPTSYAPYPDTFQPLVQWLRGTIELDGQRNDKPIRTKNSFKFYIYRYPTNTPFSDNGEYLADRIESKAQAHGWDRTILVGHSMGGLVGRHALSVASDNIMEHLLTLGTPHRGTVAADLAVELLEGGKVALEKCPEPFCTSVRAMLIAGLLPWPMTPGLRALQTDAPALQQLGSGEADHVEAFGGSLTERGLFEAPSHKLWFPGLLLLSKNGTFGDGLVTLSSAAPPWANEEGVLPEHDHFELVDGNNDGDKSQAAAAVRDALLSMCRSISRERGFAGDENQILAESGQPGNRPPSYLYQVEPVSCGLDRRGPKIETTAGGTPFITDLALDQNGQLWGATFDSLYRIDRTDGRARVVGAFDDDGVNALDFGPGGTLFGATQRRSFFDSSGQLLRIDTSSASTTVIGELGTDFEAAGDLEFEGDGQLYGTVRHVDTGNNSLVRIDTATAATTVVGDSASLGTDGVFGLHFVRGVLFGLTAEDDGTGQLVRIDAQTGSGHVVRPLSFWAAGAADREER